jgi:glucose/mannose-6-phosphate isomerase
MRLDDHREIAKYDRSDMLGLVEAFPEQCREAKAIGLRAQMPKPSRGGYENVICAGMGGSAIGADIARSYILARSKIPFSVVRNYSLPGFAGKGTLAILSSYSGDTEETLSAYKDAKAKKADIIVITSGGRLRAMADSDGFSVVTIPGGLPPRCALGYSFFPLLMMLSHLGLTGPVERDIDETIKVLDYMRKKRTGSAVKSVTNKSKEIAARLYNKFPVIYAGQDHMDCVATRWRGQFEENAKTISSTHIFPELCHNEIVGWETPSRVLKYFQPVILRDSGDNRRVAMRMDIVKKMLGKEGIAAIEVSSIGKSLLARIFSLIYTGDFASFYLAILNRRDPTPVDRIMYLKKELAKERKKAKGKS